MNIWNGLRYKAYIDWNRQANKVQIADGPNTFNLGFDARYYYPIFQNFIWAGRAAGDFSWGNQKLIYYLGGVDGWLLLGNNIKSNGTDRYFNTNNPPANDQEYAFESLAVNMRGFIQNIANGNNALVINSEFRLPVFSTLLKRTINNAFLRNFQLVQFTDFGTAWNGGYNKIQRPNVTYGNNGVLVKLKAGGVGPFAGGYGFGVRSTLLGYFLKLDAGWPMSGFFKGKPILYFAMGFDF
jgi:outer membrane protein assembly factor BamA